MKLSITSLKPNRVLKQRVLVIASLMSVLLLDSACGKIVVQVKKEAKNSQLESATQSNAQTGTSTALSDTDDFLKQLDGLKTTAADLIVKQLASQDYVGKFRLSVRKYRKFIVDKAAKDVVISDSFYSDASQNCREKPLSYNIDKDNEVLGLILQTAILAKISETNVGKINADLPKEMQALLQFITKEFGIDIQGSSQADKKDGLDVVTSDVTLKLLPIAGETIDDATKAEDANSTLKIKFERKLGDERTGTFHADIAVENKDQSPALATIDVSRAKTNGLFIHNATMTIGVKDQTPSYSRSLSVTDIAGEKNKYRFTDVMNAGKSNEETHTTIIDLDKRSQCKLDGSETSDKNEEGKAETQPSASPSPSPTGSPTQTPTQSKTPSQTPSQTGKQ
jgi:hypothetical protein